MDLDALRTDLLQQRALGAITAAEFEARMAALDELRRQSPASAERDLYQSLGDHPTR